MKIKFLSLLIVILFFALTSCDNTQTKADESSESEEAAIVKQGRELALETFTVLSGNLNKAIEEGGTTHAIEYCNLAASPLIDSLAKAHNAIIRRTSLKVRNQKNGTDPDERPVLEAYHEKEMAGGEMKPVVKRLNSQKVAFYAPIKINAFCLQCHGKVGKTITEETSEILNKIYPEDQAIGYSDGDLRGMWSIQFESPVKQK